MHRAFEARNLNTTSLLPPQNDWLTYWCFNNELTDSLLQHEWCVCDMDFVFSVRSTLFFFAFFLIFHSLWYDKVYCRRLHSDSRMQIFDQKTINIVWFLWHFKPNSCLFVKFNMVIDFYYSNAKRYMWTATEENKKKKQKYCIKRGKVNKKKKQKLYLCKREIVF